MGQQSSRLLEICSTKFTSTGLHHSVCTIARKDLIIALWFFMLVFTIEANSSCNPEQIVVKKCRGLRDTRDSSGDVESRNGDESSPQSKALCESNQPDSQSNGSISPFLNRVFIQTSGSKTLHHICGESSGKSWPPLPQSQDSTSSQPYPFSPHAYVEYTVNPDELTLMGLEENYLDVFDWMCEELDAMQRDRWDFERLAFKYNIPSTISKSLKNAFQRNGSPSYALMAHLRAKYPDLPLHHIIKNLKIIGRNDIAWRLRPYLKNNVVSSLA